MAKTKKAPSAEALHRKLMVTMLESEDVTAEELKEYLRTRNNFKFAEVKEKNILEKAGDIVYGAREEDYGAPRKNWEDIAALWNAYFDSIKMRPEVMFTGLPHNECLHHSFRINAQDAAQMMILMKIARLATNQAHQDSLLDVAGYAAVVERIRKGN
jgi:hypothetical protein